MSDPVHDARGRLSEARFVHVEGVARMAAELAERHGVDPETARWCAFVHDLLKEEPTAWLREEAERRSVPSEFRQPDAILHASVMGAMARDELAAGEEAVQAITFHPTAHPDLGRLGQILFLADKLEEGRCYPSVETLRACASRGLVEGMAATLASITAYLESAGKKVHPLTQAALQAFQRRMATDR